MSLAITIRSGCHFTQDFVGDVSIYYGDKCLTKFHDKQSGTERDYIRVDTVLLSTWLVSRWWNLTTQPELDSFQWRMNHNLCSIGEGWSWPNLEFWSENEDTMGVRCISDLDDSPYVLVYLSNEELVIPKKEWEDTADHFIMTTLLKLTDVNYELRAPVDSLLENLQNLQAERGNSFLSEKAKEQAAGQDQGKILTKEQVRELLAEGLETSKEVKKRLDRMEITCNCDARQCPVHGKARGI